MEISKAQRERVGQLAKGAVIGALGAAMLHQIREKDGKFGFLYVRPSKTGIGFELGLDLQGKISEIKGFFVNALDSQGVQDSEPEIDTMGVTEEVLEDLELLFPPVIEGKPEPNDSLQKD